MGELTKKCIELLRKGGDPARGALLDTSDLLRKAWRRPKSSIDEPHLAGEDISESEATELGSALADYCENEESNPHRRQALGVLASESDLPVKDQLIAELHLALVAHRSLSKDVHRLLHALEDIGETVYPLEKTSRSPIDVQDNVEAAAKYLYAQGIEVPY